MSVEAASDWRDHLVSAEEAVSVVRRGDNVFVGSACASPRSLVGPLERLGRPVVVLVPTSARSAGRLSLPVTECGGKRTQMDAGGLA